jgi:hypothetical protein
MTTMTQAERVLYAAHVRTTGGRDGGTSRGVVMAACSSSIRCLVGPASARTPSNS